MKYMIRIVFGFTLALYLIMIVGCVNTNTEFRVSLFEVTASQKVESSGIAKAIITNVKDKR